MTGKPKRDERGRFLPKWAEEIARVASDAKAIADANLKDIDELHAKIGTSTPLIIWNIAVLIGLAVIAAKVWGVAPY